MSSHRSQRSIHLHHDQVNAGKLRRQQRQEERQQRYLVMRHEARLEYGFMLSLGFVCFAYTMIATAVYLRFVL